MSFFVAAKFTWRHFWLFICHSPLQCMTKLSFTGKYKNHNLYDQIEDKNKIGLTKK